MVNSLLVWWTLIIQIYQATSSDGRQRKTTLLFLDTFIRFWKGFLITSYKGRVWREFRGLHVVFYKKTQEWRVFSRALNYNDIHFNKDNFATIYTPVCLSLLCTLRSKKMTYPPPTSFFFEFCLRNALPTFTKSQLSTLYKCICTKSHKNSKICTA